jgi:Ala-tRNA(Pro) deacylase
MISGADRNSGDSDMPLSNILETFLEDRHVAYGLRHHALALSSLGAARAAHIDEHFLAKSVLLEDADGPVLAVLPASRRLELSRVRNQLGRSLRLSRESDMDRFFPDCQPGALPPFGTAYGLQTLVDRSFETCPVVFFEAGDHETLVRMDGQVFLGLLHDATRAEIASEGAAWPAVGIVRGQLYNSVLRVDQAVTAAPGYGKRWRHRLRSELERLHLALTDHIAETEAPAGLLTEIEEQAPRLAREVDGLRREHAGLDKWCTVIVERMDEIESSSSLRKGVAVLLGRFARHRHRGADLVYEAFGVDIGGG